MDSSRKNFLNEHPIIVGLLWAVATWALTVGIHKVMGDTQNIWLSLVIWLVMGPLFGFALRAALNRKANP